MDNDLILNVLEGGMPVCTRLKYRMVAYGSDALVDRRPPHDPTYAASASPAGLSLASADDEAPEAPEGDA